MPHGRRWARRLLGWAVRVAPEASREWARAMLHELEFVEGDWQSLLWALGGITVLARRAACQGLLRKTQQIEKWREKTMEQMGKKAGLLAAGALGAIALSGVAFGLLFLTAVSFPQLGLGEAEWTHILFIIVVPAVISLGFAFWLWRRQRPMAVGILLSLAAIGIHLGVHFSHHFGHR